jgi:hypothetical protein
MSQQIKTIGRNTLIGIDGHSLDVPAKVDTGADRSAIWASEVHVDTSGVLSFVLFSPDSPLYTGQKIIKKQFKVAVVRSSNGHAQIRYRVQLPVTIMGRNIRATFSLADRSRNQFPVLLGRKTLHKKFVVDVSRHSVTTNGIPRIRKDLYKEFLKNPHKFHKKYHFKSIQ